MACANTSCLPLTLYQSEDVTTLAKDLLGCCLMTSTEGLLTGGMIVETEAYAGVTDRASHAYGGRYTKRTKVMFQRGGIAYVYLCYGMHRLFNVVSGPEGVPHAVLVRGILPLFGLDIMQERMGGLNKKPYLLLNGPGKVCKALGIDEGFNGESLNESKVWITERMPESVGCAIISGVRIGIDYAAEDALLPWRFILETDGYRGARGRKEASGFRSGK